MLNDLRKKLVSFLLICSVFISLFTFQSTAANESDNEHDLQRLANSAINIVCNESISQTTYGNIEAFIEIVHSEQLDVSDLDLAKFLFTYTKQGYENLPDEIIVQILSAKEITIASEYIKVDENGNSHSASEQEVQNALTEEALSCLSAVDSTWTSSNGYMQIQTTYWRTRTSGMSTYYTIAAKARWLKMPVCFFEDVLAIGHAATFDSSVKEFGYRYQTNTCCGTKFLHNNSTNFSHSSLTLDYPEVNGAALKFKLYSPFLKKCGGHIPHIQGCDSIESYLMYGIVHTGTTSFNIRSAYAHEKVAIGSVDVSFSVSQSDKSIGIGFSLVGFMDDYNARPVTIQPFQI